MYIRPYLFSLPLLGGGKKKKKKNGSVDNRGLVVIYGSPFGSLHKKKRISQYSGAAAAAAVAVTAD